MKNECLELFVPGRLCLIGEHSDWQYLYKSKNNNIESGVAITTSLDMGISARVYKSNRIEINYLDKKMIEIDLEEIHSYLYDDFFKYILSSYDMVRRDYNISGIRLDIIDSTLPMKKGLASSGAICLLTIRALNILYSLNLNENDELYYSLKAEENIGSKCGLLDQKSISNTGLKLLEFSDDLKSDNLLVGNNIYMLIADLNGSKNTIKILDDLNSCYPFYKNKKEERVHNFLGKKNKEYVFSSKRCIEEGNIKELGKIYYKYQKEFDKTFIPITKELEAPILHKVLEDKFIKKVVFGMKGCGSGGDGSVQFICKSESDRGVLIKYLYEKYNMNSYCSTIKKNKITKAVIPVGGYGTRMYPMTKIMNKELLPIKDKDNVIKPAILILLEELIDSNIEEIYLVLDKDSLKQYKKLFREDSIYSFSYEDKLKQIKEKIKYVLDDTHLGMGNALKLCKKYINSDDFMLLLGDQIYKSYTDKSCLGQILDFYYSNNCYPMVTSSKCVKKDASKYGILLGKVENKSFEIDKIVEKPNDKQIEEIEKKYEFYSVFGCYILHNNFFDYLDKDIVFSNCLEKYILENKVYSFIPDGRYYDLGNNKNYLEAFKDF